MMRRFSLVFLFLLVFPVFVCGEPVSKVQIETKIKKIQKTLQQKKASYLKIREKYREIAAKMVLAKKKINTLKRKIKKNKKDLAEIEKRIERLNRNIGVVGRDLNRQREKLYKELEGYYKYSSTSSYYATGVWYDQMGKYVADYMQNRIKNYMLRRGYLRGKIERLKALKEKKKSIIDKIELQKNQMDKQVKTLALLKKSSLAEKEAYLKQIERLSRERERLQSLLKTIIEKERRLEQKRRLLAKRRQKKAAYAQQGPLPHELIAPIRGKIVDTFGKKYDTLFKVYTRNDGIDIKAKSGGCVRAVYAGKVDYEGSLPGYGTVIIINHLNGYYTVYGGVKPSVKLGEFVKTAQCIGTLEGSKLHFEIRKHAKAINPLKFLNRRYLR